jgi:transcriptional regulator with XRE-family HTH domain
MPNIAALLKEEISRLSRKEIRRQVSVVKRSSAQHRRHIAALKRQVQKLEKQIATVARRSGKVGTASASGASAGTGADAAGNRFVAKGLVSLRSRLGLSASEFAKLVGVSAQSIYNWEHKKATPRREQVATIATLRGLGKKEARARLEGGAVPEPKKQKRTKAAKAPKDAKATTPRKRGRPAKAA